LLIADGERLCLQCALFGAQRLELHAQSSTAFIMTDQEMVLNVQRAGYGPITGFALVRGANTYMATRS
jgi:hypothetical protein